MTDASPPNTAVMGHEPTSGHISGVSDRALDNLLSSYAVDWSWLRCVQTYFGLDDEALAEMIACFFPDRRTDGLPLALPEWGDRSLLTSAQYADQRARVCRRRNWDSDMSVLGAIHLEYMAHEHDRLPLARNWLFSLRELTQMTRAPHVLDFGCGVSNYCALALETWPDLLATLADVDPVIVGYLTFRYARYGRRVRCVALPTHARLSKRARVDVDHRVLTDQYDAIVLSDVLEHTLDPMAILIHLLQRLRPSGLLFVNYPHNIEGDWHTPEAYYMWPWCMRYLRQTCWHRDDFSWFKRRVPKRIKAFVSRSLGPLVRVEANRFARRYFQERGPHLVEQVRTRAQRSVTMPQLMASVGRRKR